MGQKTFPIILIICGVVGALAQYVPSLTGKDVNGGAMGGCLLLLATGIMLLRSKAADGEEDAS